MIWLFKFGFSTYTSIQRGILFGLIVVPVWTAKKLSKISYDKKTQIPSKLKTKKGKIKTPDSHPSEFTKKTELILINKLNGK